MMRYAAEFGMTPSARSRNSAEAASEGTDPADPFFNINSPADLAAAEAMLAG